MNLKESWVPGNLNSSYSGSYAVQYLGSKAENEAVVISWINIILGYKVTSSLKQCWNVCVRSSICYYFYLLEVFSFTLVGCRQGLSLAEGTLATPCWLPWVACTQALPPPWARVTPGAGGLPPFGFSRDTNSCEVRLLMVQGCTAIEQAAKTGSGAILAITRHPVSGVEILVSKRESHPSTIQFLLVPFE